MTSSRPRCGACEDAVQAACALKIGADAMVTRDAAGFEGLAVPVLTPGAAL